MAYKKIKDLIIKNVLKPGEKIVQEKMAEQFGISKIPLIQALTILSNEQLLVKIPRKGYYVREHTKEEFDNIFDVRYAIESIAAKEVIDNYNNKIENKLKEFKSNFKKYAEKKDVKNYYDLDISFHKFLVDNSGNDLLKTIYYTYNLLVLGYMKGFVLELDLSIKQHFDIIDAMMSLDKKKTEKAILEHLKDVQRRMNK